MELALIAIAAAFMGAVVGYPLALRAYDAWSVRRIRRQAQARLSRLHARQAARRAQVRTAYDRGDHAEVERLLTLPKRQRYAA